MSACSPDPVWVSLCLLSRVKMLFVWKSYTYMHFSSWNWKQGTGGIFKVGNLLLSHNSLSEDFSKWDVVCAGWWRPLAKRDRGWEPVLPMDPLWRAVRGGWWGLGKLILYWFPRSECSLVWFSHISQKCLLVCLSGRGKGFSHALALDQCLAAVGEEIL